MSSKSLPIITAIFVVAFGVSQTLFVVMPSQTALVTHLGELKQNKDGQVLIYDQGLHYKAPIIDRLVKMDKRLQSFDVPSTRVLTLDQKSVNVDYYTKWRIKDFPLFYRATSGNFLGAREIIKRKISDALRAEFGKRNLSDIISDEERNLIIDKMRVSAASSAMNIGVDVVDVRMKRIDYPQEVTLSVYERMRSSSRRDAKKYRAEGLAESENIKSQADRDALIILSNAKNDAAQRVAEAKGVAANIFRESYSKAPDLYQFYLKMHGYKHSIADNDVIVVHPNSDRFYSDMAKKKS